MKKNFFLTMMLAMVALFAVQQAAAQAPVDTPKQAIIALLNRIGGSGAADRFEIVIEASLAEDGKDVFIITSQNGKPCIKGNTQLSVATGINWYLNHYAHINLTWNNLTTDLSNVKLPFPDVEDKHVCNTTYRYDFNTCTFSYSMAFWTWERWQQEIDWMALHGINAPLNLVGLDVLWRNILLDERIGYSDEEIAEYIAGPGFIAWFAMNNLEGWGGTINSTSTGVYMNGNPDWWYTRQEKLCRNMLQRMRELGMQPVIPGFSGQVPNSMNGKTIFGINSGDIINNGTWEGYTRPDIINPATASYDYMAKIYYEHLQKLMGVSEFYSIDPFHEGMSLPSPATNEGTYPGIMESLDEYYDNVSEDVKNEYNAPEKTKWIIQKWQALPQQGAFTAMANRGYGDRFIGLDLFADAPGKAEWDNDFFSGCDFIFCMLHNFGGRSGLHGRLETVMTNYFRALEKNDCMGIGATPEGTETNPILYDMLFELPWMTPDNHLTADEWVKNYSYSRYGVKSETAEKALLYLKESVWDCPSDQQGTTEAIILARPAWTVDRVSTWVSATIYWDTQDVLLAADQLYSIKDLVTADGGQDGIANYNYDFIDVIRQAMVDYAAQLLPLIKAAHDAGNNNEYTRLYQLYLQLMLDLDTMLSYDENFKLERWTSLARNIANEVDGTTENDRNWLEWNARTQVTVWSKEDNGLHDYSNRCWAGLIKDFHYKRWEKFFTTNGGSFDGGWRNGFEYPWTVDFNDTYNLAGDYSKIVIPTDMKASEKAAQTFDNYFGRVKGTTKNYIFPMGIATNATKSDVIPEVYRGQTVKLPLVIGKEVTVSSVQIDLNGDGAISNTETLTADGMNVTIPADAAIGKTKAIVTFSDGTVITFNLAIIVDITADRTVTAATADANMGTVAIEGDDDSDGSITTTKAVKITATANTGYNFENWTDAQGNVVSNDNPYIYYGETDATFTANFIQDKWGVPTQTANGLSDATTNNQYVNNISLAYYKREAESIYSVATNGIPTSLFTTVPQIIDVPQGASFTISWSDDGDQNLKKCFMSAYMDFNANGDFSEEGELVKVVGTKGADNLAVRSGSFQVILPYDAPLGITHLRLRFDSAWGSEYNSEIGAFNPKGQLDRMCYEIILNITDKTDKAAHVTVKTNSEEWGTVEVWTDETPDGSTGTEWDVTKGVPFYIAAEKTSEDVEFLGWYDHYGRLLTTELEYTMYAREDATYTAKFRKFLEIDGWQIEYRTEPGTEVTNKLANGEAPVGGKKYYINAYTKQSDGTYASYYLYDNGSSLLTATTVNGESYLYTCIDNGDGTFSFKNENGNYIANTNDYFITSGTVAAKFKFEVPSVAGVSLCNHSDGYTGSQYMVAKYDGSSFNKYANKTNHYTSDTNAWSSDFVFTEVSTPDNVILTEVRKSGNHDLVIPETVEILGELCKIVGFDNGLFANNKDLWTISLPATIEQLSSNVVFSTSVKGENTPTATGDDNPDNKIQVIDLGFTLKNSEAWEIIATYESDGVSTFNQWGSPLLYPNGNGTGSELFYLSNINGWSSCWHVRAPFTDLGNDYFKDLTDTKISTFIAAIENKGNGNAVITITNSLGESQTSREVTFSYDNISAFSAKLPTGLDITNFEVLAGPVPDPFEGCTNLCDIEVADGCENYYVDEDTRTLYTTGGTDLHTLAEEEKLDALRDLAEIIEKMTVLTAQAATYNPTGKATEITMATTSDQPYYIWCNAPQSGDEGNVGKLLDGDGETFFHSNWGSTTAPTDGLDHHLTVELGDNRIENFQFGYKARSGSNLGDYPITIKVQGSNNGTDYVDIAIVEPRNSNGETIENGAEWTSAVLGNGNTYTYLRFMVTATTTNKEKDGHIYFHMAEFDLYKVTSTATVHKIYEGTELTNEFAASKYDVLLDAINVSNYGTTVAQLTDAATALSKAYGELKAKMEAVFPIKLTVDEENPVLYKIISKRGDGNAKVLSYDEPTSEKVKIVDNAANSSYQAWYFMLGDNDGILIKPYNAQGKMLTIDDTRDDKDKAMIAAADANKYQNWSITKSTVEDCTDYYYIKVVGNTNAGTFSNNGGMTVTHYMGIWASGFNSNDGGSLFKFIDADFENNNARYYQLSDVKATMVDGTNIYGGTSVGLYTGGKEYREAYTAAATLETAGNTSASDDCYAAYKALRTANKALSYNAADPAKVYYIVSTATDDYCKGQYVHTYTEIQPLHNKYDYKDLVYHNFNNITTKTLAAFQFETTATYGEYKMKNLHTGMYVKSFGKDTDHLGSDGEAQVVKIAGIADGQVTLRIGNNDPMHAQDANDCIVNWGASVGNPSTWTINEVTDLSELDYTVTSSGVTTLKLAFNVVLPDGVTAYEITNVKSNIVGEYGYEMTEVAVAGEVLAKNTPVIIVANQGTYNFAVELSDENVKTVQGTMMNGTVVQSAVSEGDTKHYLPVSEDDVVVLKPVTYTEGACTMVANSAWVETTVVAESIKPYEDVLAGVYKITLETYYDDGYKETQGKPNLFVAYNEKEDDYSNIGYKMLVTGDNATTDAEADMYFTITEKDGGYSFQAQGMYLKQQQDQATQWRHSLFSEDEGEAGVYLFEETDEPGILKIKGNDGNVPYLNAWNTGDVFIIGNNQAEMSAEFSFILVTTYTLNVPEGGVTTLNLPFNVVLPTGVEAYDVVENEFETENGMYKYNLKQLAVAGNVLAKNTPVVIKAAQGSYTLNITMDDNDAIGSADGSALCGNYWERNLAADANNYQLAVTAEGVVFNRVNAATTVAANQCWMVLSDNKGNVIYDVFPEVPEVPELTDGGVYRIKGLLADGTTRRTLYNDGTTIKWTSETKTDASTLFITLKQGDTESYKLVSAMANGIWNAEAGLNEEGEALYFTSGTRDGTYTIYARDVNNDGDYRSFSVESNSKLGYYTRQSFNDIYKTVQEEVSTDFEFENVDTDVTFLKTLKKGNNFATLFLPYNVTVPEGIKAYTATIDNKDKVVVGTITLNEVTGSVIPARTAVVLHRESNTEDAEFSFGYTTTEGTVYDGNLFDGRITTGYVGGETDKNFYLLLNGKKGEAFYKMYKEYNSDGTYAGKNNGDYIKCEGNKAYMKLDAGESSSYSFRLPGTTAIEEVKGENEKVKGVYDLQGRKLKTESEKMKGLYIIDGKKVFIK